MKQIHDVSKLEKYVKKHHIDTFFSTDMTNKMELFLFKKHDYICKENEDISYLYFFVEGKVKAYNTLSNGKALLLRFYEGLQVVGDVELVQARKTSANVQAIEDSYCIGIPLEKLRDQLLNDATFLRFICSSLAEKFSRLSKNSSINLLYPLENRLAGYILATLEKGQEDEKKFIFYGNLTAISELLGTSYRHLMRVLHTFVERGIIRKRNRHFEIMNMQLLEELAEDIYK
ncbi:transcriptional regulator YeiL [Priestia taiwanensis]|uniref:Transcriptional regulator n=1 Tax=Priestia taiwanensis TaxID=1347902 RepID=A0A917ATR8_9BACI|nr:transcriptional regulator YeiL [Priestia taiwanensis]MBM7364201.1 CRP-like cAMP-binding protein [Priestia taiwanensis]GGE72468.1 transcriptional regulator [Priestia taiwanensis]